MSIKCPRSNTHAPLLLEENFEEEPVRLFQEIRHVIFSPSSLNFLESPAIPLSRLSEFISRRLGRWTQSSRHHGDQALLTAVHFAVMEYGESKTDCYRMMIKSGQYLWAKTRSYISFNHWNSKPEIYCSTTKIIRFVVVVTPDF